MKDVVTANPDWGCQLLRSVRVVLCMMSGLRATGKRIIVIETSGINTILTFALGPSYEAF